MYVLMVHVHTGETFLAVVPDKHERPQRDGLETMWRDNVVINYFHIYHLKMVVYPAAKPIKAIVYKNIKLSSCT